MYALLLASGVLVQDPSWLCPADVMSSFHAFGCVRVYGTLVLWDESTQTWQPVNH